MQAILENINAILPFVIITWAVLLICTWRSPQRIFNCILLMISLLFTMLFISGFFGEYMGTALAIMFALVMMTLLFVPFLLIVNGVVMLKNEAICLAHVLSLVLGVVIGIGEVSVFVYVFGTVLDLSYAIHKITYFVGISVFYFSCIILSFVLYSVFIQIIPHRMNFKYVIIHGCGLEEGCQVTPLLAGRLDKALKIYEKCKQKPILIPSGGRGNDENISEASAMKAYLLANGIPESNIITEDQSTTTMENLINSKRIIDNRGKTGRIAIVSSNYHVFRCLNYAKALKMKCIGFGGKVALYYWPTAILREFAAICKRPGFIICVFLFYGIFMLPLIYM